MIVVLAALGGFVSRAATRSVKFMMSTALYFVMVSLSCTLPKGRASMACSQRSVRPALCRRTHCRLPRRKSAGVLRHGGSRQRSELDIVVVWPSRACRFAQTRSPGFYRASGARRSCKAYHGGGALQWGGGRLCRGERSTGVRAWRVRHVAGVGLVLSVSPGALAFSSVRSHSIGAPASPTTSDSGMVQGRSGGGVVGSGRRHGGWA